MGILTQIQCQHGTLWHVWDHLQRTHRVTTLQLGVGPLQRKPRLGVPQLTVWIIERARHREASSSAKRSPATVLSCDPYGDNRKPVGKGFEPAKWQLATSQVVDDASYVSFAS